MSVSTQLIEKAIEGEQHSQRAIYDQLHDRIYRVAYQIVGPNDADDVLQETFVQVFQKLDSFRHDSEFTSWVHRIAINCGLQHLRKSKRNPITMEVMAEPAACRSESKLEDKEIFDAAMSKLDGELRTILDLKEFQQLPYSTIAEMMGIPEGTVGSRLNRARRELRKALVDLGWED